MKRLSALFLALLLFFMPVMDVALAANVEYTHHVNWMQQEGLLRGSQQGLELDRAITKAETLAFLQRVLGWKAPQDPVQMQDVPKTHWAYGVMQAAAANEVLELDNGRAYPAAKISSVEAFDLAKRAGLTLHLGAGRTVTRGHFLHALAEAISKTITIVHTNDTHGRILTDESAGVLGWEKIATVIEQTRRTNPHTLVLDAGDAWHGTNEAAFFSGASVVGAMNSAGVDVMTPGNHDFNYGQDHLLELNRRAAFDLVSANVKLDDDTTLLTPYAIRELAGLKVAVLGLSTPDTPVMTHPRNVAGLTFADPIETAKTVVAELAPQVDLIVALTHLGYDVDKQLAEAVPEIDFIIGGHSHTELLEAEKVNDTYIAQSGEWGKNVGRQNLIFYQNKLVDVVSMAVPYSADIAASPRTGRLAAVVRNAVQAEMDTVVAQAPADLDGVRENVRTRETDLGNLIADVMREATGADVAVTNGGGIRDSIAAGDVSIGDIVRVVPFDNTLFTIKLTGAQLKAVLEHGVRLYPETNGGFLQVSGLSFTFDPSQPEYERVVEVKVGDQLLDEEATYVVATNDFLAAGGDGFAAFAEGTDKMDTGVMLREMMIEHVKGTGSMSAEVEGRIRAIEK